MIVTANYACNSLNYNKQTDIISSKIRNNIAFKSIFDLFSDGYETRKQRAELSVNRHATSAGAIAGACANFGFVDTTALAFITKNMCKKVFKIYDCSGGIPTSIGVLFAGKTLGLNLATKAATIWPGAGNILNATIAYTLHQLEGRALIEFLEENASKLPDMSKADAIAKIGSGVKSGLSAISNETVRKILIKVLDFIA